MDEVGDDEQEFGDMFGEEDVDLQPGYIAEGGDRGGVALGKEEEHCQGEKQEMWSVDGVVLSSVCLG